jgi:multiple antibiotic resistance protein
MTSYFTFGLVAFSAVFFVVDPLALIPIFTTMTPAESPAERNRTALRASLTACVTLILFAAAGHVIFRFFGISLAAFKIAGGILLFLLSLEMMRASTSRIKQTPEEQREGIEKSDVAIIPLAIPLLSGPGAIATVMVLMSRHRHWTYGIPVVLAIIATCGITYGLLCAATYLDKRLSRTFLNVLSRIMGLILAAISVEFVLNGMREAWPILTGR